MNNETIRTFFALELPVDIRRLIGNTLDNLNLYSSKSIKWVSRDHLHITIKFIGAFNSEHAEPMKNKIQQDFVNCQSFNIFLSQFGFFPNQKNPKVFWLGTRDSGKIHQLAKIIEDTTSIFGYPQENKPFHPHITLGRIRHTLRADEIDGLSKCLKSNNLENIQVCIKEVVFNRSDLKRTGPEYEKLFSVML